MYKAKYALSAVVSLMVLGVAQAHAEGKDGVAAVVNGTKITVAEMREAYENNPQIKKQVPFDEFYEKTMDVFVDGELVYQAAMADGVTNTEAYKKQLDAARKELARKVYMEQQVDKLATEAEMKKVYDDYRKAFKPQREVKAKHILVDNEAKAREVIEKLNKGGDFDKLAKEYSKEPADLGYFTKDIMIPEFSEAAFALKPGKYTTAPIKTQFGYHVIMVEDARDAKPLPYEQVKPQLKGMVAQNALAKLFEDIHSKATITRYDLKGKAIPLSPKK